MSFGGVTEQADRDDLIAYLSEATASAEGP